MEDKGDWSSSANDALRITLRGKDKPVTFHPAFTYPIYGNEEVIFGYEKLDIRLDFTADTFHPSLQISSEAQFSALGDTKADDVEGPLRELLPGLDKEDALKADSDTFTPPGELLHEYTAGGKKFGIWSTVLTDPKAKALLRNLQILILFFIEGGSYIELDDPDWTMQRWRVFFVYSINGPIDTSTSPSYSFVGYSTAYTLFFLDEAAVSANPSFGEDWVVPADDTSLQNTLPSRSRISQFLILPPYQNAGHGSHLYNTIFDHFLTAPNTYEIPVEDPNESFDDLRDISDLIRLRTTDPAFTGLSISTDVTLPPRRTAKFPTAQVLPHAAVTAVRRSSKIADRQFDRLIEMQLLSRIPLRNRQVSRLTRKDKATDPGDKAYYFWRLLVKQRLYKHNKDSLIQLDLEERIEKLEETLVAVEKDYLRLLDAVDKRMKRLGVAEIDAESSTNKAAAATNGKLSSRGIKRKVAGEDQDVAASTNGDSAESKSAPRNVKRRVLDDEDEEDLSVNGVS